MSVRNYWSPYWSQGANGPLMGVRGLQRWLDLQITCRSDQPQPRAHGSLGVVLVGLRIPKVDEDLIPHVLRYESAEALTV